MAEIKSSIENVNRAWSGAGAHRVHKNHEGNSFPRFQQGSAFPCCFEHCYAGWKLLSKLLRHPDAHSIVAAEGVSDSNHKRG